MKFRTLWLFPFIFVFLLTFCIASGVSSAAEVTLKVANFFPPPSSQSKIMEEFCEELEKRSDGRIETQYYAGGSLLKAPSIIKGLETGIADIGFSHIEYTPGRFPVTEAAEMPIGYPSAWVANQIMNDFINEFQPKEWNKVKILWMHGNGPSQLITKKPVHTLEDLKGMTIRAPGRMGEVISALGGNPAPTPMMETYDALAKDVIDGAFVGGESIKNFRFGEVVDYVLDTWIVGSVYPFYVAMNKKKYEGLPPDLKEILDKLSGEYRERFALMWNAEDFKGREFGEKQGIEYSNLSDEQKKKWREAVQPAIDNYVEEMVSDGYSEEKIRERLNWLRERSEYLTEKQKALRIPSATGPPELR